MNIKNLTVGQFTLLLFTLIMIISTIAFFMQPYDFKKLTNWEIAWITFNGIGDIIIINILIIDLLEYLEDNWNEPCD